MLKPSDDFKQEELLTDTLKKIDILICTALIPGKKAPVIIKDNMISNLQPGSIYDLQLYKVEIQHLQVDKIVEKNGVKIMGESNILNKLPITASSLYAKNMFILFQIYLIKKEKININLEDEIIEKL